MKKIKAFTPHNPQSPKLQIRDESNFNKISRINSLKILRDLKRGYTGFTLLEILIASTIFSIILITIYVSFNMGIKGYKKIQNNLNLYYQINNVLNRLELDLKNSFRYAKNDVRFLGEKNSVNFFSIFKGEYAHILYKFEDKKLLSVYLLGKDALKDKQNSDIEEILLQVKEFNFSYGYFDLKNKKIFWQNNWQDKQTLPCSIKIDLIIELEEQKEPVYFLKIVNLAQGQ